MARINNKFATQNLNDIFGKREPKPQASADSATAAGGRTRGGSAHGGGSGGMLVLRPPVKQPPMLLKDLKTTATSSTSGLKRDVPPPPSPPPPPPPPPQAENPPVSSTGPPSSFNSNDNNNTAELPAPSPAVEISSSTTTNLTVAAVEISKVEASDTISLRPNQNHRPEIYIPPAARNLVAQNTLDKTSEILPPKGTLTPPSADPVVNEPVLEKALETVEDEPPGPLATPASAEVVKPSRPEPFRPPQLRGDAARRVEPLSAPLPPLDDSNSNSNPGRGWDRDNPRPNNFQQRGRRDEEGRYSRDVLQHQRRFERDRRGGGTGGGYYNRDGNSYPSTYAYSRSAPEARNYDIEVIRPGSGGSDRYNSGNNRDFAYGGRQALDRQIMSPPSYSYWGEGQGQGQGHANYESYEHRQDFNRRNYNNSQFKSGGMNHRDFQNRDGNYMIGRDGGGQQRRDQSYGRFGQGQFRDNFAEKAHANGRFSAPPREQQEGGNFRQFPRMQRDNYGGGGGYRYNDPARFGGDGYQRPRSGGYEGVSPRPRSSGYGSNAGAGRLVGSSDSAVSRGNFYNGRRSPISQDKVGHKDFGPQGRYQYDGSMSKVNEMQSVDVGYQRPRSGGYGGHSAGRSMAPSDMSRFSNFNGPRLPISRETLDEDFSRGAPDQYHAEGTFPTECEVQSLDFGSNRELENSMDPFNEFDSYRTRREIDKAESGVDEEHQNMGWDSSMEYNMLNLESVEKGGGNEDMLVKSDHRLDVEQKFYVEDKRHYYAEEDKKIENARKETVKQDQHAKGISLQLRQDGGLEQETREEITEVAINREPVLESVNSHPIIYEASGQLKEELNPPNIDFGLQEQEKLADRFASSRISAGRNPRLVQHDSTSNTRPRNYHGGRDAGPQPNSYSSRSSAMSWRREPNEVKNGPPQRFSGQYGDYNYGPQSRDLSSSERYQFRHG
ncbi:hypothetical protein SUGI_0623550 [Cryptomeria japonica]|uniref:uncharacterized protein LOC131038326 n=1 Tax=Cryptomeria japonica TaxID=3369 RepID=UPI002414B52F|nr:uncharacterized protein LOC131038326 [Cryptomeria japonica]GLJ31127.1 hypothetical protein SUGI_0623550 [Cryptomeria japonica]